MRGTRRTRRRLGVLGPAAVLAVLALAGCASLGGGGGTSPGGPPVDDDGSGPGDESEPGGGADGEVLPLVQVVHAGSFAPVGHDFRTVPELTLYPDGTGVTHGAQILIYPGPALPTLVLTQLDEADLAAVVDEARDAGLLAEAPDYGRPNITDVGTTTVTLRIDGEEYVHSAEALSMIDSDGENNHGLDAQQVSARAELMVFISKVHGIVERATATDPDFLPVDRFAVFARPVPEEEMELEEGIERQILPWPVEGVALVDAGGCVIVDGQAGIALADALAEANQLTVFEDGGVRYEVFPRPLLPHEKRCDDLP